MRMRKKKWAIPYLLEHQTKVLQNPQSYKGKWSQKLNKPFLRLEIGTGKGDYLTQMALLNPEEGWIGIEKESNVAAICAKKIVTQEIENCVLINQDATHLLEWFSPKEIDMIHLNFSDPWPKSGNSKRRLSHDLFIQKYVEILKDNGMIILKTDNQKLFEFSVKAFLNAKLTLVDFWVDFRREEQNDVITEYESKFIANQQPIYRCIFQKGEFNV